MSLMPPAANSNAAYMEHFPWAAWPAASLNAWSALTVAGLESCATLQRAWLEAGLCALRSQRLAVQSPAAAEEETPAALVAALGDIRDCSAAILQVQTDVLESWRRPA